MHRGEVIPHHDVADTPGVRVHELRLRRKGHQIVEQRLRIFRCVSADARDVRGQIQALASDPGCTCTSGCFAGGRSLRSASVVRAAAGNAGVIVVVFGNQRFDPQLDLFGQRIVGGAHVGEFRRGRTSAGSRARRAANRSRERRETTCRYATAGSPFVEQPLIVVRKDRTVRIEIALIDDLRKRNAQVTARLHPFDRAKSAAEGHVLGVAQRFFVANTPTG